MIRATLLALLLAGVPLGAAAQQSDDVVTMTPELDLDGAGEDGSFELIEEVEQDQATTAPGVVLRGLDKVSGLVSDLEMVNGQTVTFGRLRITLAECRYPAGNPAGDAYAYLLIQSEAQDRPVFEGWMIASSPALNALDHARYDIWALRCTTS